MIVEYDLTIQFQFMEDHKEHLTICESWWIEW